jgi:hypothetical protein
VAIEEWEVANSWSRSYDELLYSIRFLLETWAWALLLMFWQYLSCSTYCRSSHQWTTVLRYYPLLRKLWQPQINASTLIQSNQARQASVASNAIEAEDDDNHVIAQFPFTIF